MAPAKLNVDDDEDDGGGSSASEGGGKGSAAVSLAEGGTGDTALAMFASMTGAAAAVRGLKEGPTAAKDLLTAALGLNAILTFVPPLPALVCSVEPTFSFGALDALSLGAFSYLSRSPYRSIYYTR